MANNLQFLETLLQKVAEKRTGFPDPKRNYFDAYQEIVGDLRRNVYDSINAGLAANSREQGLYTDHGKEHFDTVVLYAGQMLNLHHEGELEQISDKVTKNQWVLTPYELYLLLLGVRLHDVGNIYGRENHEKNILKVIKDYGIPYLSKDRIEAKKVAIIGGAHGGKRQCGSKDTIGLMQETGGDGHLGAVDFKKIAAIVRFSDEVCENRFRAPSGGGAAIPEHNLIFHKFASSITSSIVKNQTLSIHFTLDVEDLVKTYKLSAEDPSIVKTLPEFFLERIQKTEIERRYCSRFLPDGANVREVSVDVEVVKLDEYEDMETLERRQFTLKERDYPGSSEDILSNEMKEFMAMDNIKQLSQL
ncbi:TPA: hypothetical protein ACN3ZQ_002845 [Vibrio cholerae]|uniref:HD domain-containing protein n=1 Tax=Vibrio cholerae TaxID=666 RepID=UPI000E0BEFE8|nr:hypothetical protein [Vibrio cholerae]ELH0878480.1 hypothetical protein [Vibrio cholerae]HBC2129148.1 hypothetical protein [Vibrio cholerae]HBC3994785.1 hypothetical protein [Vibrio cholerae]HDL9477732.1 hypothetical protein [Vibrio cholerae]HDZ3722808.1 hypothetical protein [Vibrio cholerae]